MNSEIFRLAAVLYADNNYEVSPITLHRKIIESIFIDNNNDFIGIHALIDKIKLQYSLDFTEEEIKNIVSDEIYFHTSVCKIEELKITLSAKRYENISNKIRNNNLDFFIQEFHNVNYEFVLQDLKNIIYSFLYEVFQTNILSFSKLIDPNVQIQEILNLNDHNLNSIEIEIINKFLNWENDEKNKLIFDISNLSLEYCLITNKKGGNFKIENLKNKNFYLDTNVIFRAIGINGENRKKRMLTFLDKFKEAKESLLLSKFTEEEIKKTLDFYIGQMTKYNSAKINSEVFLKFNKSQDFIDYYHKWRRKRTNDSTDLFKAHVFSLIEELKIKYEIKNDYKEYFDVNDSKIEDKILDIASKINTFKSDSKSTSYLEASIIDAKNIYLIEYLRNGHYINIFDCKYYFISADQILRKWDYSQNSSIPIVLLPSQWMSILLRYLNRTSDDFKSFVSFLNISNGEKGISNENLQLILNGISEITTDFTQQSSIVSEMINLGFKGILEKSNSEYDIIEKSKLFAKSKLEKDIENLQKDKEQLESKFEKYQENTYTAIETLKQIKDIEKQKKDIEIVKNNRIIQELIDTKAKFDLSKYKSKALYCIPISIVCIMFFILMFLFQDSSWNMVAVYSKYANSLEEGSMQKEFCKWLWTLPCSILIGSIFIIYNRLFDKEKSQERLEKYKEKWTKEINSLN
ncbi:hypothetical protein [Flavobacterium sasangense]|uniref:hypothetical protein n=1 Tax=Flavobacterium sasangense TaxID=503361 RepID=UPI00047BC1EA|nr:hypothetical protein [Flavobacterium sasangense]